MKKLFLAVVTVVLLFGFASAQDINPAIHAGAKSLNFTFGGLGVLGLGSAGLATVNVPNFVPGFGASYFLNNEAALRLGLQVAIPSQTSPANPPPGKPGTDATTSAFGLGVGADYLMYTNSGRVRPYMGAGLYLVTGSTDQKTGTGTLDGTGFIQAETKNAAVNINGTTYQAGTAFGLQAILGAEFFIYNEISVSAEYDLNIFNVLSQADQTFTQGTTSVTTKSPSVTTILGFGAAGATVHIYF